MEKTSLQSKEVLHPNKKKNGTGTAKHLQKSTLPVVTQTTWWQWCRSNY